MDSISDMLTRIRNAQAVKHETVNIPFSNIKLKIAEILKRQGFILHCVKKGRTVKKTIRINLKYMADGSPAITGLKKVSKPGQRIYEKTQEIKLVKGGRGIAIISTSKGLMTGKEAKKQKLGGEALCKVW